MSLFSYIAFPREIDLSVFPNNPNNRESLKSYQVGELAWGKNEYRIERNVSGAELEFINFDEGLLCDFFIHGIGIYKDKTSATFKNCFKNKHIYAFEGSLNYNGDCSLGDMSEYSIRMMNSTLVNIELSRKQLFDLILQNLQEGEFVEIYAEIVNHTDFNLGPPLYDLVLNMGDILFSSDLNIKDRLKVVIKKNGVE